MKITPVIGATITDAAEAAAGTAVDAAARRRRYQEQELDLPEIIDLLASDDYLKVTNAAGRLQHMSYKDDEMKSQIK